MLTFTTQERFEGMRKKAQKQERLVALAKQNAEAKLAANDAATNVSIRSQVDELPATKAPAGISPR